MPAGKTTYATVTVDFCSEDSFFELERETINTILQELCMPAINTDDESLREMIFPCIQIRLKVKRYYDPGCSSGPMDMCYPPEEEIDVEWFHISIFWTNPKQSCDISGNHFSKLFPKILELCDEKIDELMKGDFDFEEYCND